MAFSYTCLTLQRAVIPIILVLSALFRPVGISFVYLLMFFISPFIPVATTRNFKGSVTAYLIILIALSTILLLCHIVLQIIIISLNMDDTTFASCGFTVQLLRHVGFINFRNLKVLAIIEWLAPEVAVFFTSLAVYLIIKRITTIKQPTQLEDGLSELRSSSAEPLPVPAENSAKIVSEVVDSIVVDASSPTARKALRIVAPSKKRNINLNHPNFDGLIKISPLFCLATLFFAAVLRPSVPGGFYFLIFLLSGSYWATFQTLKRGFAILLRFVMIILVIHIICIVAYQTPWMQDYASSDLLVSRLISLEPLVTSTCEIDIRIIIYSSTYKIDSFLSPIVMLFSYYALALTTKNLIKPRLVRHNTRKQRTISTSSAPGAAGTSGGDIPLNSLEERQDEDSGIFDQVTYGIISVGGFIYQNSYIFTNILMMAWSIVYHSWLTFVLLLWANVLWMIPNQRKAMMRSSPFIVIYAEFLLLAQYIYGMNLHDDELPASVNTTGVNLRQIGLERPQDWGVQPCVPLIVKTSFLLMFWVTLRQFFKEKSDKRRQSTVSDTFTSLQITTGGRVMDDGRHEKKTSKFLKKFGDIIKNLLVRLWIWLLILVIFLCAITGKHMTGFRIAYMALFLFFLLVFQSSSKAWIKIMYGFWLFLIFEAMSILILIYTYQFDKFDKYWNYYLNVSETLQTDIGLERYKTKDLFLHLVSPTIIVILTVIQVHYFHKRLIASLQKPILVKGTPTHKRKKIEKIDKMERVSNVSNLGDVPSEMIITDLNTYKELVRVFLKKVLTKTKRFLKDSKDIAWHMMELHLIKVVYITAFVCCISQICLLHVAFIAICILGVISNTSLKIFLSRIMSIIVSVIILTKMMYQVTYLDHEAYDIECVHGLNYTRKANSASWFGLDKATAETGGLVGLLRKYIFYMVIVTMHAVVTLRQTQMRIITGQQPNLRAKVLFPEITRQKAEQNLRSMMKYLCNYGFYKFGFEISLITLVATITYRQDVIAVVYAFWLLVLLCLQRSKCAKIWIIFQMFIAVSIFIQYIVLVNLPPSLCLHYPWDHSAYSESVQLWALVPGNLDVIAPEVVQHSHAIKLIFDFILLVMVNRQKRVFYIESQNIPNYPGGSNKSVVNDLINLGQKEFENPTRDFLSHVRNYLDIFMNAILCGFYWITLGVVFLAGTNISDFLALGYLIGAFVFLWQGSDFYLRPVEVILQRWNWLIIYNVFNIVVKTCLQLTGCLFMKQLTDNCCWLVHMLGINCVSRARLEASLPPDEVIVQKECPDIASQIVLVWDAVCFAFLLFQMRIFKSHYFCHIINDTKANTILASRGGEIIENLRQKQIEHRQEHEKDVLIKIKRKMEKIRATQQKMLRPIDKPTHFDAYGYPIRDTRPHKRKEIKLHPHAVRAGDYYMFEDMDEKFELDLIEDEVDFMEDKISESEKKMTRRKTVIDTDTLKKDTEKYNEPEPTTSKKSNIGAEPGVSSFVRSDDTDDATDKEDDKEDSDEDMRANPIIRLLEAFLVSLTIRLNRFSRNYRYVNKILAEEKKSLKESRGFHRLGRVGAVALFTFLKGEKSDDDSVNSTTSSTNALNTNDTNIQTPHENNNPTTNMSSQPQTSQSQSQSLPPHDPQQHVVDIIETSFDTVDAKSIASKGSGVEHEVSLAKGLTQYKLEDDFASRDHHILVEVLISTWYAILSNTELICYIVVFIVQVVNASIISLPLPFMVFLWGTLSLPRPTKTFWVTLIAYTQAIVLIKCIFQFKLIWANYINLPNQPLSAAKIFGVELDSHHTIYDLLLLLVLFFHRFILKSQGLWKSEYVEEMVQDAFVMHYDKPISPIEETKDVAVSADDEDEEDEEEQKIAQVERHSSMASVETNEYSSGILRIEQSHLSSVRKFFFNMVKKARLPSDVYALMFLCDFINFFVLLFGFTAFGSQQSEGDGGVQTYLAENKVPIPFLIMLLVQFMLIVIDRALYLRKALINKIIFHFFSVIGIHIWMFFIVPMVTERSFYSLAPPIIFYIIKCFYLLLSSYQIKCGYPKRILGNFLTKGFSLVNMISFKFYMLIPFLYELRTVLDWVCTDTTMTLFDWLKMEDIFSDIYFIKCSRQMETDFPAIRAEKKATYIKLLMGGTMILCIVIAIWGPLCLFALGNAVGQSNVPYEVTLKIRIGPYEPIYELNNRESVFTFNNSMFEEMSDAYKKDKNAITFLSSYDASDITAVRLPGNSPSMWGITPPDKLRLLNDLKNDVELIARFTYSLTRIPPAKGVSGTAIDEITYTLDKNFTGREAMIELLDGSSTTAEVTIPQLLPKFLKVPNTGDMSVVNVLMPKGEAYRPIIIKMNSLTMNNIWWEIKESCIDAFYTNTLSKLPYTDCESGIVMYTFNDKKFPSTFSFLTAGGIIGLYSTFVLIASRLLKSFISGQNRKIMFEDLPYVDRVLQLCLDIYLVREALEFALEEDLFAKLLFLYRSPETMIKWTRPKEDTNEDETDTESVRSRHSVRRHEQHQQQ